MSSINATINILNKIKVLERFIYIKNNPNYTYCKQLKYQKDCVLNIKTINYF